MQLVNIHNINLPNLTVEQIHLKSPNDYPFAEDIKFSLLEIINNLQSKFYKKEKSRNGKKGDLQNFKLNDLQSKKAQKKIKFQLRVCTNPQALAFCVKGLI